MNQAKKVGRNERCSCGSGKKYKACRLLHDEASGAQLPRAGAEGDAKSESTEETVLWDDDEDVGEEHRTPHGS